jgi:hypothetical protein
MAVPQERLEKEVIIDLQHVESRGQPTSYITIGLQHARMIIAVIENTT